MNRLGLDIGLSGGVEVDHPNVVTLGGIVLGQPVAGDISLRVHPKTCLKLSFSTYLGASTSIHLENQCHILYIRQSSKYCNMLALPNVTQVES